MQNRPSNVTVALVRFCTFSQYVANSALARCTWVVSWISAPTLVKLVGITVQMTCHVAGQLNVNQVCVWFGVSVPFHCTPQTGTVIQPSTGISHKPRFRVPARSTHACG